jgi:hypothetical protein
MIRKKTTVPIERLIDVRGAPTVGGAPAAVAGARRIRALAEAAVADGSVPRGRRSQELVGAVVGAALGSTACPSAELSESAVAAALARGAALPPVPRLTEAWFC